MSPSEDTDVLAFEICAKLQQRYDQVATEYSSSGNIIGVFFHDLVIHFTGIIIHRNTVNDYGGVAQFPWVNKKYAITPERVEEPSFLSAPDNLGLRELIKSLRFIPVAVGQSIPLGYGYQQYIGKVLKIILPHLGWTRCFIPGRKAQFILLEELILELCKEYQIKNSKIVCENWKRYADLHITDKQTVVKEKGILVGTRNNLHNRKLAINFLQQEKEVIGFTHGEISNHVLDEPVYGYSDKTLCTTLVDYGTFSPDVVSFPPIIKPIKECRRSSPVVAQVYQRSERIEYQGSREVRNLFIPTIYQQNFLYGPKHAYESQEYYRWHQTLEQCIPNLTTKLHPKTRFRPKFECEVENRMLENCIEDYDVLIFDFFATGAVHAIFSDKPVIYFDIGLRSLNKQFMHDLKQRCTVINIDFALGWEEQIQSGLQQYEAERRTCSNTGLEKYAL